MIYWYLSKKQYKIDRFSSYDIVALVQISDKGTKRKMEHIGIILSLFGFLGTFLLIRYLINNYKKFKLDDVPNQRSSHKNL